MGRSTLHRAMAPAATAHPGARGTAAGRRPERALPWRIAVGALLLSGLACLAWSFLPAELHPGDPLLISDAAFLPGSLLVALLAWHASGGSWSPMVAVLVAGVGGLTAIVMARQLVTARENVRLAAGTQSRHAELRLRSLVDDSTDLILVTDAERAIQYATPSVERALRLTSAELTERSFDALVLPDDLTTARAMLNAAQKPLPGVAATTYELRLVRKDGRPVTVEASVADRRDDPEMRGLVITLHDIERRKALEEKLARQAFHDPLTGLAGSSLFLGSLAQSVTEAQAWGNEVGLLVVQLDGLRAVNLAEGRGRGDAQLVEAAATVAGALRPGDLLGRIGGDELAILLGPPVSVDAADALADRILAFLRVAPVTLTTSIGTVVSPTGNHSPDDLLRTATAAAVEAKRLGRDRWVRSGSSPVS
jgi:diguanylate cyclase (GGDEF)-like protein/PAS domain S-box-containing protein